MLYKVVLSFESGDKTLKCGNSTECYWLYWAELSYVAVYYAVHDSSVVWVCGWNPSVTIQMKATLQYFPAVLVEKKATDQYKAFLMFESVDEILSMTIQVKNTELEGCKGYV